MLAAFGVTDITSFSGFMGAESLNVIWPAIVIVFATLSGASLVAKEIEDGTSELWLSVRASRWRLLLAKMAALALALLAAVALCVVAVAVTAIIVGASFESGGALRLTVVMALFLLAIASYTSLLSALTSTRGRAAGLSMLITVASYLAWVVAGFSDSWNWLKGLSLFSAYTPQKAMDGQLDPVPLGMLLLLAGVCTLGALLAFQRRDGI
jgi:ABC-2 type transport system permease protein